jgi:hypothetical protein
MKFKLLGYVDGEAQFGVKGENDDEAMVVGGAVGAIENQPNFKLGEYLDQTAAQAVAADVEKLALGLGFPLPKVG